MTIAYHGTPITPAAQLARMQGEHFCVSFYRPDNADVCEAIGASVMWDNGAFSAHTKGVQIDERALCEWLEPRLYHPHRAVVLDAIDQPVDVQREYVKRWPFPRDLSWPVWHLDKPLDYLSEICDGGWAGLCLGSAGQYWQIASPSWERRMAEVYDHLARRGRLPWLHGLRMLGQVSAWPLASADSTNVAQNHGRDTGCAYCKARQIKAASSARQPKPLTADMFTVAAE
ncbi:MAG: hypothetical protein E6Q97_05450 [Desulfurellales bacterium]|nr:MAG: hypothetical protein E6Q97_05450 [Desulfurellales bacterium]